MNRHNHHVPRAITAARAAIRLVAIFVMTALIVSPSLAAAQPAPGHSVTSRGLALSAPELGPDWSMDHQSTPSGLYQVVYTNPSGRAVEITTGVAPTTDDAEKLISGMRYVMESTGSAVNSVQAQGFGDGRAFESEFSDGQKSVVSYMFRVHEIFASVDYQGPARATDVSSLALAVARKQEAKLWAALAPVRAPPLTSVPVIAPPVPAPAAIVAPPVPTSTSLPEPAPTAVPTLAPAAFADPYCRSGEQPVFHFGFAALSAALGSSMGNASSCEYGDPRGSGDTLQTTSTGLSFYRQRSNTPTFTTGFEHWALSPTGVVYWTGDSIDPPESAQPIGFTGAVQADSATKSSSS